MSVAVNMATPPEAQSRPHSLQGAQISHDGREVRVLNHVFAVHQKKDLSDNPDQVLKTIDDWGTKSKTFLMNVGENKASKLALKIREQVSRLHGRPIRMLELGSYLGWSALRFAPLLPKGSQYLSLEAEPLFAAISTKLVELAGLDHTAKVLVGLADEQLRRLALRDKGIPFDIVFIDHHKDRYLEDFKLMEELFLIAPGTLVIADNVIHPGAPDYLEYVRSRSDKYSNEFVEGMFFKVEEPIEDGMEVSLCIG